MKWLQVRNKTMQDQVVFNTSGDEMRSLLILKACRSVAKLCLTRFDPMDCSTTGSPVLHYLPKFAQVHVHSVGDAWGHTCLFRVYLDLEGLWGGVTWFYSQCLTLQMGNLKAECRQVTRLLKGRNELAVSLLRQVQYSQKGRTWTWQRNWKCSGCEGEGSEHKRV